VTTWSIGEAAAKCGLSQHTLRWYERIGLLGAKIDYYASCLAGTPEANAL
jgi:MerR family regulatory protein